MTDNVTAKTGATDGPDAEPGAAVETEEALPHGPYGAWPSPISAAQVAGDRIRVAFPIVIGEVTWWQERRPEEAGRTTVVRRAANGAVTALLPAPWCARTRVHEYGGLSYLPVPSPVASGTLAPQGKAAKADIPIIFANYDDQRLYLAGTAVAAGKGEPVPLTPDPAAAGSAVLPEGTPGANRRAGSP